MRIIIEGKKEQSTLLANELFFKFQAESRPVSIEGHKLSVTFKGDVSKEAVEILVREENSYMDIFNEGFK